MPMYSSPGPEMAIVETLGKEVDELRAENERLRADYAANAEAVVEQLRTRDQEIERLKALIEAVTSPTSQQYMDWKWLKNAAS